MDSFKEWGKDPRKSLRWDTQSFVMQDLCFPQMGAIIIWFHTIFGYKYLAIAGTSFVPVFSQISIFTKLKVLKFLSSSKNITFHFSAFGHIYVASTPL